MEIAIAQNGSVRNKVASDGFLGMIFLLATEAMLFAGLISAYIVNRAVTKVWPPYGQPRLPIEITAANTAILLTSGILLFMFSRKYKTGGSKLLLMLAFILGVTFLTIQGTEWARMIDFGLTQRSSIYGAFFYLIIGIHAVHVVAGLQVLLYLWRTVGKASALEAAKNKITICSMYWYFVVGIWPILYVLVYLI